MKILLLNGLDINQQAQYLSDYINNHTSHKAHNVVMNRTYLDYPADQYAPPEAPFDFEKQYRNYDFFIFRWVGLQWLDNLFMAGKISAKNTILRVHGSEARYHPWLFRGFWSDTRITMVTNGYDYSLTSNLPFAVSHIPPMVDTEYLAILAEASDRDGQFTVCHAPTDRQKKGTEEFLQSFERFNEKHPEAKLDVIEKLSWKDAIKRKAMSACVFDQDSRDVGIGTFGVNLLEALAMGKQAIGFYNKYTYSFFPELERYVISKGSTEESLELAFKSWKEPSLRIPPADKWVKDNFDIRYVGRKWLNLIEHISES